MKKFFSDFKAFAMKGNVVDMAIGVVIGGAFGKIVTSLVTDIISPLIGLISGGASLTNLKYVFKAATKDAEGNILTPESALTWGNFLQSVVDFIIIALSIFLVIRIAAKTREKIESMKKKEEEAAEEAAEEPKEDELSVLKEIRELLSAKESDKE